MHATVLHSGDAEAWDTWVGRVTEADSYYLHGYVVLAEILGEGEARLAVFDDSRGLVIYPFIERSLGHLPFARELLRGHSYSDITSPYGYGGPIVHLHEANGCTRALAASFDEFFVAWCRSGGVVSEFVRFHPLARNARGLGGTYHPEFNRPTVYVDLTGGREAVWDGMHRSARANVNSAREAGLRVEVLEGNRVDAQRVDGFAAMYYETMRDNQADDYYMFPREYFEALFCSLGEASALGSVWYENRVIAGSVLLAQPPWLHYHLGASHRDSLRLRPNDLMMYELACWGAGAGCRGLHLGGGRTPDPADSLLRFKAKFSPLRRQFYVGKRVHLPEVYRALEKAWMDYTNNEPPDSDFFPSYRLKTD